MKQIYANYKEQDHAVWNLLFERQMQESSSNFCTEYMDALHVLKPVLNSSKIPEFKALSAFLLKETGWQIEVVPGIIPVEDFFVLLSQKKFCSSTWIRPKEKLDYLEEPDIFHDVFGHIPLLIHPDFAHFAHEFGKLGTSLLQNPKAIIMLQRLYWYTVEFGLIEQENAVNYYGAGIISSFGEVKNIAKPTTTVFPFTMDEILEKDFINSEIQTEYYQINSLNELSGFLQNLGSRLKRAA